MYSRVMCENWLALDQVGVPGPIPTFVHMFVISCPRRVFVLWRSITLALTLSYTQSSSSSIAWVAASSSHVQPRRADDERNLAFSDYSHFGQQLRVLSSLACRTRSEKQRGPEVQYGRELTTVLESRRANGERILACANSLAFRMHFSLAHAQPTLRAASET